MHPWPDESRVSKHVTVIQADALIYGVEFWPALLVAEQTTADACQAVALANGVPALAIRISFDCRRRLGYAS